MSLDEPAPEAPAPGGEAAPAPEAPAQAGGNKVVSQLAGKLGQTIRTAQDVSSDDIKGAVNSLLAAAKGKLDADAVSDIEKKLNDAVGGGEAAPAAAPDAAPAPEQPVAETLIGEEDTANPDITKIGLIQDVIRRAGLEKELTSFPEGLAFDIAEGIYVFIHDYNDNSQFIAKLAHILRQSGFKAAPHMGGFEDLEENGQAVYNALVKMEEDILKPSPRNRAQMPNNVQPLKDVPGMSLNETQKRILLSKLK